MYRMISPEPLQNDLWSARIRSADGERFYYFFRTFDEYLAALIQLDRQRGNYRGALCYN